jgi:hypothetical protein
VDFRSSIHNGYLARQWILWPDFGTEIRPAIRASNRPPARRNRGNPSIEPRINVSPFYGGSPFEMAGRFVDKALDALFKLLASSAGVRPPGHIFLALTL